MDPQRRLILAALPGLALMAAGCPKSGELSKAARKFLPVVRFNKVNLRDINFEKVDLDFLFDVENPAPLKVALSSFQYALALEGQPLFDGKDPDGLKLEAAATTTMPFPFTMRWSDLAELLKATQGKDELGFGLTGALGFNTPVGELELPYKAEGKVPALRRPRFKLEKLRLESFEPLKDKARLAIDMQVSNRGGSTFTFKGFDYKLNLAGNKVADGLVQALGEVGADSQGTLTLPVDLSLSNLGAAVVEAFAGKGKLKARVAAGLKVGTPWGDLPLEIDESEELNISG
jgi:LEA14-like dessication related protein